WQYCVAECKLVFVEEEEEFMMDTEEHRRILAGTNGGHRIGYGALQRGNPACGNNCAGRRYDRAGRKCKLKTCKSTLEKETAIVIIYLLQLMVLNFSITYAKAKAKLSTTHTMLNFIVLQLFCLLLLFTTTTSAQPYKATEHFLLDCGSSSNATISDQKWDGDELSEFVPSNITTTSFTSSPNDQVPSVPQTPYSTARIFNASSFTYSFPVSQGPKFLRLYFYPSTYSGLTPNQSFLSVSSNGYSLLTNFSAFLTASYLGKTRYDAGIDGPSVPHFVKEFLIYVKDTQILQVTFKPSPNSYAFINGIEVVSMPQNLYFNATNPKPVGMITGPVINDNIALENFYRLNIGGGEIKGNNDTDSDRVYHGDTKLYRTTASLCNPKEYGKSVTQVQSELDTSS
ncbi:receptor-like protein kinase FERONIA, partial [Tanacetum coccineum]